ncbi:hypothetical protein [Acidobacterium sp. S8]|uniref:hypothetical protein n=1 Tax=Acidobacterium sp. S8 TaxID=1641854 RepID=UPI00131D3CA7|nr:hypothetical protein [Acidobacterium sp. S8]
MNVKRSALSRWFTVVFLALMSLFHTGAAQAQSRVSDRDVEALMRNLKEDSKSFRENFDAALKKSAIRRTSQEKDAKSLVASFEKQTDSMLNEFKKTRKGDVAVETTISNAQEIERLIRGMQLDPKTLSEWDKIQAELSHVSAAFGIHLSHGRT